MGLDMYLHAEKFVRGWDHSKDPAFDKIIDLVGVRPDDGSPHVEVSVCIGYWRKANQIHNWFVQNVQGGVDECQDSYVSREKLTELLGICKTVLAASEMVQAKIENGYSLDKDGNRVPNMEDGERIKDPSVAIELLPPSEGFFFGSQGLDQWYIIDIESTVEIIERALQLDDCWTFQYHASW